MERSGNSYPIAVLPSFTEESFIDSQNNKLRRYFIMSRKWNGHIACMPAPGCVVIDHIGYPLKLFVMTCDKTPDASQKQSMISLP